ncbi:unnamed protein product, partial [Phytomonas sp. Hart1]
MNYPSPRARAVRDAALIALTGVIEDALRPDAKAEAPPGGLPRGSDQTTAGTREHEPSHAANPAIDRIARILVNPSGGLLRFHPGSANPMEKRNTPAHETLSEGYFESWAPNDGEAEPKDSDAQFRKQKEMLEGVLHRACCRPLPRRIPPPQSSKTNADEATFDGPMPHIPTTWEGVCYVQTRLPDAAIVRLPLSGFRTGEDANRDEEKWEVCRLAGGVEPYVNFAVGTPLEEEGGAKANRISRAHPSGATPERGLPFASLTCLLRLHARTERTGPPPIPSRTQINPSSSASSTPEPWRLGRGLDVGVPVIVRTLSESGGLSKPQPSSSATADGFLGQPHAETYLLPQRELLLRLFVPPRTRRLCGRHNRDRLERQIREGHSAPSARGVRAAESPAMAARAPVWGGDQRRTHDRLLRGRFQTANAAMEAAEWAASKTPAKGASGGWEAKGRDDPPLTPSAADDALTSHEVRALPGDVVFIPKGWAYTVRRIVGSVLLDQAHRADGSGDLSPAPNTPTINGHHSYKVLPSSGWAKNYTATSATRMAPQTGDTSTWTAINASDEGEKNNDLRPNGSPKGENPFTVNNVEVDAFCLLYKPYPELSEEQARVYMPANYTHRGVEEFYENGGNPTYYKYE